MNPDAMHHRTPLALLLGAALLAPACRARGPNNGNVLIIITDDMGIDKTAVYGEHPLPPSTPNIDALAANGVLFRNAYAHPTCTPSRASLLTGRHPSRHGLGRWIYPNDESRALPDDEVTIPELLALSDQSWSTAALGKWHLTGFEVEDPAMHPLDAGFESYAGALANPEDAIHSGHEPRGYERWEKDIDGDLVWTTTYMTTDTFDDAIAAIQTLPEPWFLYVATNGAHPPMHNPPAALLDEPLGEDATELEQYNAIVQLVDAGIGRLLDSMPEAQRANTTVVYTSDNGSPNEVDVILPPWDPARAKGTVYEGGVNVPLIVSGPLVQQPGSESAAWVSLVDILPTVAEIAEVNLNYVLVPSGPGADQPVSFDGHSLVPYLREPDARSQHEYAFSEEFYPNGDQSELDWRFRMVRDGDWKLVRNERENDDGELVTTHEFYRMTEGAWDEGEDLLKGEALSDQEQSAYDRLMRELDRWAAALVYAHPPDG